MQGNKGNRQSEKQLAMLGHELRNVLNGMLGATQLLGGSGLSGEQRPLLETLQQSAGQLGWLIESIGSGSANAEFPFTPLPAVINGVDLLEQAIRCHTPAAASNKNLLLLMIEPGLPAWWHTDAYLLRLIIDNLLSNAIKFTHSGEVIIEVRRPAGEGEMKSGLELRVTDNGPGISKSDSGKVFEPWVQLGQSQEFGGSGMGLYVCQRIVSSLEGNISHCADAGPGACFRVWLPEVICSHLYWKPIQASKLFTSMHCAVSARPDVCRSLEMLLARLGIRNDPAVTDSVLNGAYDIQIMIEEAGLSGPDTQMQNHLILTRTMPRGPGARLTVSRFLQAPFLESTLGPMLMEMALDSHKSALASGSEVSIPGEKPG